MTRIVPRSGALHTVPFLCDYGPIHAMQYTQAHSTTRILLYIIDNGNDYHKHTHTRTLRHTHTLFYPLLPCSHISHSSLGPARSTCSAAAAAALLFSEWAERERVKELISMLRVGPEQDRARQDKRREEKTRQRSKTQHDSYRWVADPRLCVCPLRFNEEPEGPLELLGLLLRPRRALRPLLRVLILLVIFILIALPLLLTALAILLLTHRAAAFVHSGGGGGSWTVIEVIFEQKVFEFRSYVPHLVAKGREGGMGVEWSGGLEER